MVLRGLLVLIGQVLFSSRQRRVAMFKQTVAKAAQPQARGYFGIDAKAYGFDGHVDSKYLKVPSASHIFNCANKLNSFNNGWDVTAPGGC